MDVRLAAGVRDRIIAHAVEERPNECCGLLVGRPLVIEACVPAANVDPDPRRRYRIDPATHIALNRRLRGSRLRVVGAYHSHPRTAATPSDSDVSEAAYPEFVWVIVSLQHETPSLLAYRVEAGSVVPVRMLEDSAARG
jgi:proteasome lid subunit RPN8/RPN11